MGPPLDEPPEDGHVTPQKEAVNCGRLALKATIYRETHHLHQAQPQQMLTYMQMQKLTSA